MAAPTNWGESDITTEDFYLNLSPLPYPRWPPLRLTPSPPRPFLPSSNSNYSMVTQYQGSNQSMDDPPQNQEHDDIVDPAPYLARDSASDWRPSGGGIMTMNNQGFEESNMGFEESMEMTACSYFTPSPTNFSLYIVDADPDEREMTLKPINLSEQDDVDIVDRLVYEFGVVEAQQIQNRGGELEVVSVNGLEKRDFQGSPTTPEPLLFIEASFTVRIWAAECRFRSNRLNNGRFTTVEDAISAYELVARQRGLFENENRSNMPLQLPLPPQELNPVEDFGLVCCNGTRNDEIESVGTGSEETEDCIMADRGRLNSGCLRKRKTMEKNTGGERRSKKTNGVRIAIPLEDILQNKGMRLKNAANHLGVSQSSLKYACREYGIPRWPPRKLITQSHPTQTPALVDQEGIPQSNSDTLPSDQALAATVEKITSVVVKEILPLPFLPSARQVSLDEDFGNFEAEAVEIGRGGTWQSEIEEGQLNSSYLGKEKRKEMIPRGERINKETSGSVRIVISLEEILQTKEMPLKDAAKHLKVSKSTLKRACREYDIPRWPPRGEHKLISQLCPNESHAVVDKEPIPQLNSDTVLPSNQVSATIGTESVTVKARFGTVTIRFQLSCPWRMVELKQQVEKRLESEAGTYHICYKDQDNDDDFLIACDDDLLYHISHSRLPGTNSIEVFLKPK